MNAFLADSGGAAEVGVEYGFSAVADAEPPLHFLNDAGLFGIWREAGGRVPDPERWFRPTRRTGYEAKWETVEPSSPLVFLQKCCIMNATVLVAMRSILKENYEQIIPTHGVGGARGRVRCLFCELHILRISRKFQ